MSARTPGGPGLSWYKKAISKVAFSTLVPQHKHQFALPYLALLTLPFSRITAGVVTVANAGLSKIQRYIYAHSTTSGVQLRNGRPTL
jgi:hypothetical protein